MQVVGRFDAYEINPVDEGINQPLAVGLFTHIQYPEFVQVE